MTRPTISTLITGLLLFTLPVKASARAQDPSPCRIPDPVYRHPPTALTRAQANQVLAARSLKAFPDKASVPRDWARVMGVSRMADIDAPFDPGCSGGGGSRLVFAGAAGPFGVLLFQTGGVCLVTTLHIYRRKRDTVNRLHEENITPGPRTAEIRQLLSRFGSRSGLD